MTIETKLSIGQKAWFVRNNCVMSDTVKEIFIRIGGTRSAPDIDYVIGKLHNMPENDLFASKEDLLKSL